MAFHPSFARKIPKRDSRNQVSSLLAFERLDRELPNDIKGDEANRLHNVRPFPDLSIAIGHFEDLPVARLPLNDPSLNDSGLNGHDSERLQPATTLFGPVDAADPYSGSMFERVISNKSTLQGAPPPSMFTATAVALAVAVIIVGLSSMTSTPIAPQPQAHPHVAYNLAPPARIVGTPYIVTPQQN